VSRSSHLSSLHERIRRLAGPSRGTHGDGLFATGHQAIDARFGGGLACGCVHELFAADADDAGSVAGLGVGLAWRARRGRRLLWLRSDESQRRSGAAYAPGLAELGLDPGAWILGRMPDETALLKAATDALRCAALGAVVIECRGNPRVLDLTASRRLALAARDSGVTAFLLRGDATPVPSAAETRWAVRSAASRALAANAPGLPMFEVELLRRRAGPAGMVWRMEWDRDVRVFREPAPEKAASGAVVSLPQREPPVHLSA